MQTVKKDSTEQSVYYERIQALMAALNVSSRAFSRAIGRSENWSRVPKKSYYVEDVVQIMRAYPQVNIKFLMYGELPVLSEETETEMSGEDYTCRLLQTINQQNDAILQLSELNSNLMQKLAELTALVIQKDELSKDNSSVEKK